MLFLESKQLRDFQLQDAAGTVRSSASMEGSPKEGSQALLSIL